MSWRTSCNYCSLQYIKKSAKADGLVVTILPSRYGGHQVYTHPKSRKPDTSEGSKDARSWFMALTDHCCC